MTTIAGRLNRYFAPPGAAITIDTSDLRHLVALLGDAADNAPDKAAKVLDRIVPEVHAEAVTNARSFHRASTGELASVTAYDRTGMVRRVHAPVRQAFFLEYGSPTTGAPRPWLTGPAERGSLKILEAMSGVGAIW